MLSCDYDWLIRQDIVANLRWLLQWRETSRLLWFVYRACLCASLILMFTRMLTVFTITVLFAFCYALLPLGGCIMHLIVSVCLSVHPSCTWLSSWMKSVRKLRIDWRVQDRYTVTTEWMVRSHELQTWWKYWAARMPLVIHILKAKVTISQGQLITVNNVCVIVANNFVTKWHTEYKITHRYTSHTLPSSIIWYWHYP